MSDGLTVPFALAAGLTGAVDTTGVIVTAGLTEIAAGSIAMVPISGSAYTYSYTTLGELVAWIIGRDLIIEYAVGDVAVAISWSNYFKTFVAGFGIHIPDWPSTDYRTAAKDLRALRERSAYPCPARCLQCPCIWNCCVDYACPRSRHPEEMPGRMW